MTTTTNTDLRKQIEELTAQLRRDVITAHAAAKRAERLLKRDDGSTDYVDRMDDLAHVAAIVTRQLVTRAKRLKQAHALHALAFGGELISELDNLEDIVSQLSASFAQSVLASS